jgi:hypothetical protein
MLKHKILKALYPGAVAAGEQFGAAFSGLLLAFTESGSEESRAQAVADFKVALPAYLEGTKETPRDPDEWVVSRLRASRSGASPGPLDGTIAMDAWIRGLLAVWASSPRAVALAPDIAAWAETSTVTDPADTVPSRPDES